MMDFGIQMGHGMQSVAQELISKWGRGSAILSPRNFSSVDQMARFSKKVQEMNGTVYVDPQLFSSKQPSRNLEAFPHWQACSGNLSANYHTVVDAVLSLNDVCGIDGVILPASTAYSVDEKWEQLEFDIIDQAKKIAAGRDLYLTIALGSDVLKDILQVGQIVRAVEDWDIAGVYLVCEHPADDYLTDQSIWLLNLMQLVAGIKFAGKTVYVGYASHQMLLLVLAKCDYIFSGNFLNVRRFQTTTFETQMEDGKSRRTKWYYAPQTLSEFRLASLDIAYQKDIIGVLKTPYDDNEYVGMLFSNVLPTDTGYSEADSFKHYLYSLREQCVQFTHSNYKETLSSYRACLQTAEFILRGLREVGIFDRDRNFSAAFQANYQAVFAFDSEFAFRMDQEW